MSGGQLLDSLLTWFAAMLEERSGRRRSSVSEQSQEWRRSDASLSFSDTVIYLTSRIIEH